MAIFLTMLMNCMLPNYVVWQIVGGQTHCGGHIGGHIARQPKPLSAAITAALEGLCHNCCSPPLCVVCPFMLKHLLILRHQSRALYVDLIVWDILPESSTYISSCDRLFIPNTICQINIHFRKSFQFVFVLHWYFLQKSITGHWISHIILLICNCSDCPMPIYLSESINSVYRNNSHHHRQHQHFQLIVHF